MTADGDHVIATARKPQTLADLAARYGRQLDVETLDVAQRHDVDEVVTGVLSKVGHIDVVVNKVGAFRRVMVNVGDDVYIGDPAKFAAAIFDTTRTATPPLRLALGADSDDQIQGASRHRLAAMEGKQRAGQPGIG